MEFTKWLKKWAKSVCINTDESQNNIVEWRGMLLKDVYTRIPLHKKINTILHVFDEYIHIWIYIKIAYKNYTYYSVFHLGSRVVAKRYLPATLYMFLKDKVFMYYQCS